MLVNVWGQVVLPVPFFTLTFGKALFTRSEERVDKRSDVGVSLS
jgi:hypothetical protein